MFFTFNFITDCVADIHDFFTFYFYRLFVSIDMNEIFVWMAEVYVWICYCEWKLKLFRLLLYNVSVFMTNKEFKKYIYLFSILLFLSKSITKLNGNSLINLYYHYKCSGCSWISAEQRTMCRKQLLILNYYE